MTISILIVDDHPIVRVGIAAMISKCADMAVAGVAGTGAEALERFSRLSSDIVLLDLRLPDISGLQTLKQIKATRPEARVIIHTMYEGDEDIFRAMEAGAQGYLVKGLAPEVLLTAIRRVHAGGTYIPVHVSMSLASRATGTCLSGREREVLQLLAEGKTNREIAGDLGIRESTVKCHISVILTRLNANDRTQAVIIGIKRGYVHLSQPA